MRYDRRGVLGLGASVGAFAAASLLGRPAHAYGVSFEPDESLLAPYEEIALDARHPLASTGNDPVGCVLVIADDTSGSIKDIRNEYRTQKQATARALNSESFRHAVKHKPGHQSVALALMEYDGKNERNTFSPAGFFNVRLSWIDIRGNKINDKPFLPDDPAHSSAAPDDLDLYTTELAALPRVRDQGGTQINQALKFAGELFPACPWQPIERRVLDLYTDGYTEHGVDRASKRLSEEWGVTVNGLIIKNKDVAAIRFNPRNINGYDLIPLDEWAEKHLATREHVESPDGIWAEPGRVWVVADDGLDEFDEDKEGLQAFYDKVEDVMTQKLMVETAGVDQYRRTMLALGREPQPVPEPVYAASYVRPPGALLWQPG